MHEYTIISREARIMFASGMMERWKISTIGKACET